ncbi:hypothetical protein BLNAU_14917 [Blattamonas nauphoetae]|uniref:Uncharacterized protein n=1 Tax=Blattamonas nauphoetae TaxID=2049346 RepID=A0ABQ9XFW7_9EUKA|nr:hypothetical protein BLNAU_14917 [Blattamonas nauphoetae]
MITATTNSMLYLCDTQILAPPTTPYLFSSDGGFISIVRSSLHSEYSAHSSVFNTLCAFKTNPGIFVASDLNFANGIHASDESLLGGRYASHTSISHSTIRNITDAAERTGKEDIWLRMTTITNVDFVDVQNPTSGCIAESRNGGSSHTSFCFFVRGADRSRPSTKTTAMNEEVALTDTVRFQTAQYICLPGEIHTITSCLFRNGTGIGNGVAIRVIEGIIAIIDKCYFVNNRDDMCEGGAIRSEGTLSLSGSIFINNIADKGGALSANGSSMTLFNCSFFYNIGFYEGGALGIWDTWDQMILCLFSGNTGTNANDIVAWNEATLQQVVTSCLFSTGTNDVKVGDAPISTIGRVTAKITSGETVAIDQTATADQCGDYSFRKCQSIGQALELISESTTTLTITIPASTTTLETGLVITDSRTLSITAENGVTSSTRPTIRGLIPISTHLFYVEFATLNLNSLMFDAQNTPHFITALSSSVVVISNCLIDGKDTSINAKQSIDIYRSTLTMTDTTVQNIKSANGESSNAIFLNDASAAFTRCTFTSLSNPRNGGAIHAKLLAYHQLTVKGCTFDGCSCMWGGGGVYVDLRSSTRFDKTEQVVVGTSDDNVPTRFTDCTSDNAQGNWILIDMLSMESNNFSITLANPMEDAVQSIHDNSMIGTINVTPYDPPSTDSVYIFDGGSDKSGCSSSLPCSSFAKSQTVGKTDGYTLNIRSSTTWTVDNEVTKPVTIKSEDANRAILNLRNVTAAKDSSLGGYLRIAAETRLDTVDLVLFQATTTIAFVALMTDTTLTINNVEMKTDTTSIALGIPYQSAFVLRTGQVIIESTSFSQNPDFNAYAPIWLSGGSLIDESENEVTMSMIYEGDRGRIGLEGDTVASTYPDLKLKKWIFGGSPTAKRSHGLWLKNVGTVELTDCSFSSFKKGSETPILDGSAIHAELCSSSSFTITKCSFTSCSSLGNGGSVSATLSGGSFTITDSTFSSTSSGNGGGLCVVVSGTGVTSIAGCSFSSCSSSKGGGLYLDISQSTQPDKKDSFSITKGTNGLSFTDCSATTGSWMYFVMTNRDSDYDRLALQSALKESPPSGVATGHAASEEFDLFEVVDYSGLYLSDSGSDGNTCKTVSKACQSLTTVLSKTLTAEKIVFVVGWGAQNGSTVVVTKDFHLKSNTESYSVFHLDGQNSASSQTDPLLQIESHVEATLIDFRIKQKSWKCAFIHVLSGGSLTFHSAKLSHTVSFGAGDHFDSFIHAKGGTVTIDVLDIQKFIDFNGNPPFWLGENSSLIKTSDYQTEIQVYYRSKESFDGGIIGTEASDSEGTTLDLRNITFIGAYSEGSGEDKGAILLNKVKSANIEECIFRDFVSTLNREETVIKITPNGRDSVVTIKNCQFMNTKRKNSGAILLTNDHNAASFTIQGSELIPMPFTSCQSEDAGGSVQLAVRGTTLIQFCVFSVSKTTTADKSGGAVSAFVDGGQLTVTSCTFTSCSSLGNGGAIFVDLSSLGSGSYLLSSLSFGDGKEGGEMNSHGVGKSGRDVFVSIGSLSRDILVAEKFSGSCPSREETSTDIFTPFERESISFRDQSMTASILYLFFGYSSGQLIVDSNGEDNALCGSLFLPCSSISVGYHQIKPSVIDGSLSLLITSDVSHASALTTTAQSVSVSQSDPSVAITVPKEGSFSISAGTLQLVAVHLKGDGSSRTSSLFSLSGGQLEITSGSIADFSSTVAGTIFSGTLSSSSSLIIERTTIASCTSSNTANVLSLSLSKSSTVRFLRTIFRDCASTTNVISLTQSEVLDGSEISLLYCEFDQTAPTANSGAEIFFGNTLLPQANKFSFAGSTSNSISDKVLVGAQALNYLLPSSSNVFRATSQDEGECDDGRYPGSQSLPTLFGFVDGSQMSPLVLVDGTFPLNEALPLNPTTMSLLGRSTARSVLQIELGTASSPSGPVLSVGSTQSLILESLGFSIKQASPFISTAGTMSIEKCSFTGTSNTGNSQTISTTAGHIFIAETTFENLQSEQVSAILSVSNTNIEIGSSVSFSSCKSSESGGALTLDISTLSDPVVLSQLKFTDCSASKQGGGLSATVAHNTDSSNTFDFTLQQCVFISCQVGSSSNSDRVGGGGFALSVENMAKVAVVGCSFKDCTAPSGTGLGGGFYLDIRSSTRTDRKTAYSLTTANGPPKVQLSFESCSAEYGSWFFIDAVEVGSADEAKDVGYGNLDFDYRTATSSTKDMFAGQSTEPTFVDLLSAFPSIENALYLGVGGDDSQTCDSVGVRCSTLPGVQSKVNGNWMDYSLFIHETVTFNAGCSFSGVPLELVKTTETTSSHAQIRLYGSTVQVNPPSVLLFQTMVTVKNIEFVINQKTGIQPFIVVECGQNAITFADVKLSNGVSEQSYPQTMIHIKSGMLIINKLTFEDIDTDSDGPIWLSGGSLIDESENEVTMKVIYGGDRGWIGVEGNTVASTYPDLKLKKWIFGGSPTAKRSHGLWLKNVGIVELTSCSFSSFKKGSEATIVDGSAIHAELCSSSSLTITKCSFASCSSHGNGGAIFVDLSSLGSGSYLLSSLSFGDGKEGGEMNSHGVGKSGRDVFVSIGSLSRDILVAEKFSGSCPSREETSTDIFTPFERESIYFHDDSMTASILYLFFGYSPGQLIVDSNGEDNALCGSRFLPCSSISVGYANCVPTQIGTAVSVEMRSDLTLNSKLAMKDKIVALSRKGAETLTVGQNGQISGESSLSATATLTLSSLTIEFDSWTGSEPFISLGGGSLVVAGCSFGSSSSPLNGRFCAMNGGSLSIDSASSLFDSSATRTTELFAISGGVATISLMTVPFSVYSDSKGLFMISGNGKLIWTMNTIDLNNAEVKGIVLMDGGSLKMSGGEMSKFKLKSDLISGSGTVEMFGTTFTSISDTPISSNSEGFHVVGLEIQSGQTVSIGKEGETTSFSKCSSSAAGGAIEVVVKGLFTVQSTSFSECSSSGNGGALSMIVEGSGVATVSGCSFAKCDSDGNGGGFSLDITGSTLVDKKSSYFVTKGPSSLSFAECSSSGTSNWIFISFTSFENDFLVSKLDFDLSNAIPNQDALGFDQTSFFDLVYPPPTDFFISDVGSSDSNSCRDESHRCMSLDRVLSLMEGTVRTVFIVDTSTWTRETQLETPLDAHDFALTIKTASTKNAFATIVLQKETAQEYEPPNGFILIETSVTFDKINLRLAQKSSNIAFISTTANGLLRLKDVHVEKITPPENVQKYDFQSFLFVTDGTVLIEKLSFGKNTDFGTSSPIWLSGGSLIDESENEVTMSVIYGGDRGWIGVEGDTSTSTYPDLKLKKWIFGGSPTAKKSHGLWLKNVGIVELTSCSFSSFKKGSESQIIDGSAIHAELCSSSSLTITKCSFTSCSSLGNGGSVSATVAGGNFIITQSSFASSSASLAGGAVSVDLSSLDSGSYSLTSLNFTSSCTSSFDGKWVFMTGRGLASLVTKERWAGTFNSLSVHSDADKLWGLDLAEDQSSPLRSISLLHFLLGSASRTTDSIVFVGQSGKDQFGCGETKATLCRTVEWGVKEAAGSVVDIFVASSGLLSSPIILSNTDVLIAPDSDRLCPFVVSLEIPSSAPASMIRVERDSALALRFLSFSFSVPASVDMSAQSSHTISSTSFLSSSFKSSVFVLSDCHSLSVENTSIANNSFDTSDQQLSQTGHIPRCAINSSQTDFRRPAFLPHVAFFIHTLANITNTAVRLCRVRVSLECEHRKYHVLTLLWQPN